MVSIARVLGKRGKHSKHSKCSVARLAVDELDRLGPWPRPLRPRAAALLPLPDQRRHDPCAIRRAPRVERPAVWQLGLRGGGRRADVWEGPLEGRLVACAVAEAALVVAVACAERVGPQLGARVPVTVAWAQPPIVAE